MLSLPTPHEQKPTLLEQAQTIFSAVESRDPLQTKTLESARQTSLVMASWQPSVPVLQTGALDADSLSGFAAVWSHVRRYMVMTSSTLPATLSQPLPWEYSRLSTLDVARLAVMFRLVADNVCMFERGFVPAHSAQDTLAVLARIEPMYLQHYVISSRLGKEQLRPFSSAAVCPDRVFMTRGEWEDQVKTHHL